MSDPALTLRTALAEQLADAARAAILPFFRAGTLADNKAASGFDPVTEADRAAERAMRRVLAQAVPGDAVVGEEYDPVAGSSDWTWVLDPIDGTRAFIAGTATWGVLIAVCHLGEPVIGVIDQPWTGERWTGTPEGTVWRRGGEARAVHATAERRLDHAIAATTDPYLFSGVQAEGFARLRGQARLTRYGLDCMAYAYLASGGIGVVAETGLKDVDAAALVPVVRGAGGVISTWSGAPVLPLDPAWDGSVLAAGNPDLHLAALAQLV
jgi:histidinol phosphatase-like enzyme (inositol monophosphatase family)